MDTVDDKLATQKNKCTASISLTGLLGAGHRFVSGSRKIFLANSFELVLKRIHGQLVKMLILAGRRKAGRLYWR